MNRIVVLLALLSLSISCSKVKGGEKTMSNLRDHSTLIYQKEAEDSRTKNFAILNSKEEGLGAKLIAAAGYFKSFEFQQMTSSKGSENNHEREDLLLDAANEFTNRISDLYKDINVKSMSPTKVRKKHSAEQSFYALSVTVHLNKDNNSTDALSLYDVIRTALEKDYRHEYLNQYEEVLVSNINKEMMIELIKARVDMFSALALKNLIDKRNTTLSQKLKATLFKISGGNIGSIQAANIFDKSNDATKKQTIKYLESATDARDFLKGIEVEKELEKNLNSAYTKINLDDTGSVPTDDQSVGEEGEAEGQSEGEKKVDTGHKEEVKGLIQGLLE